MSNKWPTTKSESDYMLLRQNQNMKKSKSNSNENWFALKLKGCGYKFSRQRRWGYRIFDFWCHQLGVAIEIDGPDHNIDTDREKDISEFIRSRIVVIRVRNMNESDAYKALEYIKQSETWNERRTSAGMKPILS